MRIAVICTADSVFNRHVLPARVSSFAELVGIVAIHEPKRRVERLRAEWRRSGWRTADVLFRLFYGALLRRKDTEWIRGRADEELAGLPAVRDVPVLDTQNPTPRRPAGSCRRSSRIWS